MTHKEIIRAYKAIQKHVQTHVTGGANPKLALWAQDNFGQEAYRFALTIIRACARSRTWPHPWSRTRKAFIQLWKDDSEKKD